MTDMTSKMLSVKNQYWNSVCHVGMQDKIEQFFLIFCAMQYSDKMKRLDISEDDYIKCLYDTLHDTFDIPIIVGINDEYTIDDLICDVIKSLEYSLDNVDILCKSVIALYDIHMDEYTKEYRCSTHAKKLHTLYKEILHDISIKRTKLRLRKFIIQNKDDDNNPYKTQNEIDKVPLLCGIIKTIGSFRPIHVKYKDTLYQFVSVNDCREIL